MLSLDNNYDFDFNLIGLITKEKEYKLAWLINDALNLRLVKAPDAHLDFLEGENLIISYCTYQTEHAFYKLIKNKTALAETSACYLIPELKEIDYFFTVQDETGFFSVENCVDRLRKIKNISLVEKLELKKIHNRDNFIF